MQSDLKRKRPTAALVLETTNLRAGGGVARAAASLERLLVHLQQQTRPLSQLDELVITHDGFSEGDQERLENAAGVPIRFCHVPLDCGYYEAKNIGFEATSTEVVAFGDADCWPEREWLELLLAPFTMNDASPPVVAGRTTYRPDLLGAAASTIDFMYFPSPLGEGCTRNFYANNVAFRREVFAQHRYAAADDIYRGHCQLLGLRLQARRVRVAFEPRARTIHRFPDSAEEFLRLRLLRGQDAAELTPFLVRAYLPQTLQWLSKTGPVAPLTVLAVRFACSVRSIGRQEMPPLNAWEYLKCVGAIAAISAADAVGGVARGAGGSIAGRETKIAQAQALSYHADVDQLGA
ncbi:MAG: glycosyltransferase family 2 protein [Deltaproteobacteria bacterium]